MYVVITIELERFSKQKDLIWIDCFLSFAVLCMLKDFNFYFGKFNLKQFEKTFLNIYIADYFL